MVGSFTAWNLITSYRFWYVIDLNPELGIGEPIWVIDSYGFAVISVPLGIVFFIGFLAFFRELIPKK